MNRKGVPSLWNSLRGSWSESINDNLPYSRIPPVNGPPNPGTLYKPSLCRITPDH
jgi:hypothetical protein